MPGPGGPGSAAERALGQRLDQRLLKQQVLVAGFPDAAPEVYIVRAEPSRSALVFCEAGVDDRGSVDVGRERVVSLVDIGSVSQSGDGVVIVQGHSGQMLVRMHFETVEDEQTWAQGLNAIVNGSAESNVLAGVAGDFGDDVVMLQARSRQLQNQIGSLEELNGRRDQQLNKMVKRLDGAMQMLAAVQDMCGQQRKVIQVQKVAITELSKDLGLPVEATDDSGETPVAAHSGTQQQSSPGARSEDSPGAGDEDAEDTEEQLPDTDEMRALLEQADQMQNLLQMLEARSISAGLEGDEEQPPGAAIDMLRDLNSLASLMASLGPAGGATTGRPEEHPEPEEEDCEEVEEVGEGEDEEVVRDRLRGLEAEKEKFEGLLRSSQQEHQDLLEKLNGMKAMMSQLGLQEGDLDFEDDLINLQ